MHQDEHHNNCDLFRENLFAFHEKRLSGENLLGLENHMSSCTVCSSLYNDFLEYIVIIDQTKTTEINPFVSTRIIQALESSSGTGKRNFIAANKRILQPISVTFLLALAAFTGFILMNIRNQHYSVTENRKEMIQMMQSDLNIAELIDNEKLFIINP